MPVTNGPSAPVTNMCFSCSASLRSCYPICTHPSNQTHRQSRFISLHSNIKMEQNFKIRAKLFIVLYTSFFVHNKCSVFTLDLALLDTSDGIKRWTHFANPTVFPKDGWTNSIIYFLYDDQQVVLVTHGDKLNYCISSFILGRTCTTSRHKLIIKA